MNKQPSNVNDTNQSSHATNYGNATECNGAFHLITKPTRVTDSSATVIDHIITNDTKHAIYPSIVISNFTEHHLIKCKITTFETMRKTKKGVPFYRQKIVYSRIIQQ